MAVYYIDMKLPAWFKIILPVFVLCIVFAVLIAKLVVSSGEEAGEIYSVQTLSVEDQDVLTKHIIISTAPAGYIRTEYSCYC